MKAKLKNSELINLINGISKFEDLGQTKDFPVKLWYAFDKTKEKLIKAYEPYDKSQKRLREKNEKKPDEAKYLKDLEVLLGEENEVEIHKVSGDDFSVSVKLSDFPATTEAERSYNQICFKAVMRNMVE